MAKRGHRSKTKLEASICEEMKRRGVAHEHRVLHYRVRMETGKVTRYDPAIVAHRGPILFLVEPCLSYTPGGGAVERHTRFLDQHSAELVFVLVAPKPVAERLPPESYDELYTDAEVPVLVRRIRDQDPRKIARPFQKRRTSAPGATESP
ncbi:MAG: hypothetical protein HY557_08045 [Euryarchaeota archaeon]|nr:hypothetical protein [Euryarchaeota archaeon]